MISKKGRIVDGEIIQFDPKIQEKIADRKLTYIFIIFLAVTAIEAYISIIRDSMSSNSVIISLLAWVIGIIFVIIGVIVNFFLYLSGTFRSK